jgi:cephalosporin hydroxylase
VRANYIDHYDGGRGGPQAAIEAFLSETGAFEIDISRHKYFLTFNPNGYLRRVR